MSPKPPPVPSVSEPLPTRKFWYDESDGPARRAAPRVHANVAVRLRPGPEKSERVNIRSNDLSFHGMQVRCDRETAAVLRPNDYGEAAHPVFPATLELEIDGVPHRARALARVAHVTPVPGAPPETEIAIGMSFVRFQEGAEELLRIFIEQHLLPAD